MDIVEEPTRIDGEVVTEGLRDASVALRGEPQLDGESEMRSRSLEAECQAAASAEQIDDRNGCPRRYTASCITEE